jgi:hypothetical protein
MQIILQEDVFTIAVNKLLPTVQLENASKLVLKDGLVLTLQEDAN